MENIHNSNNTKYIIYLYGDIDDFSLHKEDIELLTTLGLPFIENNELFFSPLEKLKLKKIYGENYLVLGHTWPSHSIIDEQENLMLLDLTTRKIFFYSKTYFSINYSSSLFWTVNINLHSFMLFLSESVRLHNRIWDGPVPLPFQEAKIYFQRIVRLFSEIDSTSLKLYDFSVESYWRKYLYEISYLIEENYDYTSLNINLFQFPEKMKLDLTFWTEQGNCQCYSQSELYHLFPLYETAIEGSLLKEDFNILTKVGFPQINTFLLSLKPTVELSVIDIDVFKYLVIGYMNVFVDENLREGLLIQNISTANICFYTRGGELLEVNNTLSEFLFFAECYIKTCNRMHAELREEDVEIFKNEYAKMVNTFRMFGIRNLIAEDSFWKYFLLNFEKKINEKYDISFGIDWLSFTIKPDY